MKSTSDTAKRIGLLRTLWRRLTGDDFATRWSSLSPAERRRLQEAVYKRHAWGK